MTDARPLEFLASFAEALDMASSSDRWSEAQERGSEGVALKLRRTLRRMGVTIDADVVVALIVGAQLQALLAHDADPSGDPIQPDPHLSIVLSRLARDLLMGEIDLD